MSTKTVIIILIIVLAIGGIVWFVNAPKAIYPTTSKVKGSVNKFGQYCAPPRMWHNGFCV